jgi:hypothetical protein
MGDTGCGMKGQDMVKRGTRGSCLRRSRKEGKNSIHTLTGFPGEILKLYKDLSLGVTIAKLWKQPRSHTAGEWGKKMWFSYITKFYSATKKNEILFFAGKWMELENTTSSEVSQVQKAKGYMCSLICGIET